MSVIQDTFCTLNPTGANTTFIIYNSHLIQDLSLGTCSSQDYININNQVTVYVNTSTCTLAIPTNITRPFLNVTIFVSNPTQITRKVNPAWTKFKITRVQFTNYTSKQLYLYLEHTRDYIPCLNGFPTSFTSTSPSITFASTLISRESNCFDPLDMFYIADLDTIPTNTTHYYYDTLLETADGFAEPVPLQFAGLLPSGIPAEEFSLVVLIVCLIIVGVSLFILTAGLVAMTCRQTGSRKKIVVKKLAVPNPFHKLPPRRKLITPKYPL